MGLAMWWRVTIYIIILGNVNGDETVSETNTTSDLASPVYLTSSTMAAPTQEINSFSTANTRSTSIADDLTTVALTPKEKTISRPSDPVLETSANVSSSERLVFSTESYASENSPKTSLVSTSSFEFSVSAGSSSSNVVTVHSTTLHPTTAPGSSIQSDSITSHQPESSDITIVPSLTISTTEMTKLSSQSETSSSVLLHTETITANIQSTATEDSVISSFSSLPTASASQPLTSSSQPLTSASQPFTSSSLPLTSLTQQRTSSSLPQTSLTSSLLPLTSSSLPLTPSSLPLTSSSLPLTSTSIPFTSSSLPPNVTSTDVIISTDTTLVTSDDFHSSAVPSIRFVESSMAPSSSWSLETFATETLTIMETSSLLKTSTYPVMSSFVDNSVNLQNASDSKSSSLPTYTIPHSSFQTSSSLEGSVTTQLSDIATSTPPSVSPGLESSGASLSSMDHASQHSIISSSLLVSSPGSSEASSILPTHTAESVVNTSPSSTQPVSRPTSVSTTVSESVTSGISQHSMVSNAKSMTTEFTSAVTFSSSVHLTNATVHTTDTTRVPHSEDPQLVNHTFEMVFQGNCVPLVKKDGLLLKAFWNQLKEKLVHELKYPFQSVKADNIACEPLRITFTFISIPQSYFKQLCTSLKAIVSDIHINVTIFGQLEYYRAVKLNTESTITADKTPPPGAAGLEELDLIVLIAAGSFCLVLILVGLVICIREYYHRKRTRTFEFANMYQAEDFTLTKIPRPAVTYTEKGVDINTNGHSNGDAHETEKETLMESIQLRVNSNENGLMVGLTGTLERQSTVSQPSASPSPPASEHLQLVPREEEPLQSQDNPIYYIDDDHSE